MNSPYNVDRRRAPVKIHEVGRSLLEYILVQILRVCTQGDLYCYNLQEKDIKVPAGGRHATDNMEFLLFIITCTGDL